ncbi:MAG: outer membrane lipid asymmetry maintenance protein MlaD [Deltaproteobacteria bacterium]|nr:outer membrane lipid asymmetry maintenance protein MlaD [Deltaproteobacteria bacterium]MBW2072566.1 outer membrane lipid asymmetry maintenance protein MlaD [Deltaproteobacteria bacterium]
MRKYAMETTVGIFVAIGLLCVAYMTVKLGDVELVGSNTYPLIAKFTSVSGLRVGSAVDMFGIQIGKVEKLALDQDDAMAVVELSIQKGIEIYDDAIAAIKTEGLIGDRYVGIDPGGAGELLKPGDAIAQTQPPIDIGELIGKYAFGDVKK